MTRKALGLVRTILGLCAKMLPGAGRAWQETEVSRDSTARNSGKVLPVHIAILAGGRSRRMGLDKSRLVLRGRTLLQRVRSTARRSGYPVHVVRTDSRPGLGPLGGVWTAFHRCRAEAILFLACDMPYLRTALITRMISCLARLGLPAYVSVQSRPGFPFLLRRSDLPVVESLIERGDLSLGNLFRAVAARNLPIRARERNQLRNLNTPAEWEQARRPRGHSPRGPRVP